MKTMRQMLRRPVKTVAGLLLVILAVAVMVVSVGQLISLRKTQDALREDFTSVAIVTGTEKFLQKDFPIQLGGVTATAAVTQKSLPEDISAWLSQIIENNPEMFICDARQTLASAYLPGLQPDLYTDYMQTTGATPNYDMQSKPQGMPYSCAVLRVTLTDIGEPTEVNDNYLNKAGTIVADGPVCACVALTGTITRVVALQEGFADPTGYTINLTLKVANAEAFDELGLCIGEEYLVYGMDYYDLDWTLRSKMAKTCGTKMPDALKPECLILYSEEELEAIRSGAFGLFNPKYYQIGRYVDGDIKYRVMNGDLERFQCVRMTVSNRATLPQYVWIDDADGGAHLELTEGYSYLDENGNEISVSKEEYCARYAVPTIVHLDGSVEDFLASDEAALWNEALANAQVNNHAFPIIGVDKLTYVGEFAKENARICDGRTFTEEELQSGAKVCILSDTLAEVNGIRVGDTISPQFYNYDRSSPYQYFLEDGHNLVNPGAYFYTSTTPFCGEAEEFTVIGLYSKNNSWESVAENSCAFTPNTIFVPNNAISSTTDTADLAFFRTIVLENGKIGEFAALASQAGYDGLFTYHDQGYSELAEVFLDYSAVAKRVIAVGLAVYAVIAVLYLLLFPASQGKTLAIMSSLGATRWEKMRHILVGSLAILLPGTVAGAGVGMLLWERVCVFIVETAGAQWSAEPEIGLTVGVTAAQLAATMLLVALIAYITAGKDDLMKRK